MEVTRLTKAADIRAAVAKFKENVTEKVYDQDFKAIGRGFEGVITLIGKQDYIYVKCEKDGGVVGMAYGYKKEEGIFYIADIISKAKSNSGSAMVNWFAVGANVGMERLRMLQLSAARKDLQETYAKPHYGFSKMEDKSGSGLMKKDVA